jgi:hypothetical protein
VALALALASAGAARAETRRVDAVGVVAAGASRDAARDAALRAGLREAVVKAAQELSGEPPPDRAALDAALGSDPTVYAARYRILEDRGVRPRLLLEDAAVESEYVLFVEVEVDAEKLRRALGRRGISAAPASTGTLRQATIEVEEVPSFPVLNRFRRALQTPGGAISAVPIEISQGRAVLAVEGEGGVDGILRRLESAPPEGVQFEVLDTAPDAARVRLGPPIAAPPSAASEVAPSD